MLKFKDMWYLHFKQCWVKIDPFPSIEHNQYIGCTYKGTEYLAFEGHFAVIFKYNTFKTSDVPVLIWVLSTFKRVKIC